LLSSRLTECYGAKNVFKNADDLKKSWYYKKWEEMKTAGEKPPTALTKLLDSSFPTMSAEAKKKIIELVTSAPAATDAEVAALTSKELAPLAPGLTTHHVSVAGQIFRIPHATWEELSKEVGTHDGINLDL
jgi:hypothetical protein